MARGYYNRRRDMARAGRKRRQYAPKRPYWYKRGAITKVRQPIQYFTRTRFQLAQYSFAAGAAASGGALKFQLNTVPNSSEFTNLYDQYMIKAIKVSLIPRFTEASAGVAAQQIGNMWSVIDYDDATAPANVDTVLQYQNVKRTQMNKVHSRYFKPKIAKEVFATGVASGYAPGKAWLDCNSDSVEHYAIKLWFDSAAAAVTFDVVTKFYLAFKNVR